MAENDPHLRPSSPLIFASAERPPDLNAVEIKSARLTLRPVTAAFAKIIFAEFTPEITKFMLFRSAQHISETEHAIAEMTEKRRLGTDLTLAILTKESQEFLGCCGLHGRKNPREPELGIWLKKSAHGHAFGREAIAALRGWAERELIVDALIYPVDRNNIASRKIAKHLGGTIVAAERTKTMSGGELDSVIYRIPARKTEC
jgi:RimJ/RimL family protein N-acetyltransferase